MNDPVTDWGPAAAVLLAALDERVRRRREAEQAKKIGEQLQLDLNPSSPCTTRMR